MRIEHSDRWTVWKVPPVNRIKAKAIEWAWRLLHRLSDDYEWIIYVDGEPIASCAGWMSRPGDMIDLYAGAYPDSDVHMDRRLRAPVQVRLG